MLLFSYLLLSIFSVLSYSHADLGAPGYSCDPSVMAPSPSKPTSAHASNGTFNKEFWAADCYHYSSYGHALVSTWYWQNMLQPVGAKTINANLSVPALPLACPDPSCPYIRTTKNSINCQQFNGTCISDGSSCTKGSDCCSGLCFNGKCS
uniref:WAP domain-containing protein n=1 Tax=Acrobeloides nanus TaxID=290746 RepID=A0A914DKY9_9BILA